MDKLPPIHPEDKDIPSLEGLLAQITPENRHAEVNWGPAVGKEIVHWVCDESHDPPGPEPG
jgi:hypothetical protein